MASTIAKPLLSDLVAQTGQVPSSHVRPVGDRPDLANVDNVSGEIPVIDLHDPGRPNVVKAIGRACESHEFFLVTNHGIPAAVVEGMLRVAREFFRPPESERMKCYSDDPKKAIRLSTSFNMRTEKVSNWRDFLRLHCYHRSEIHGSQTLSLPMSSIDRWPSNPPSFREVVGTYSKEARALALRLLEAISESLGLERSHMVTAMGRHAQHMAVNYYPPCPQPELTYRLPGHKDPNAITLLLQDGASGLQVQRNGRWVAVNPVPNALAINIGDQLQALSNDRYKSVLHRVIVNSESERISVPPSSQEQEEQEQEQELTSPSSQPQGAPAPVTSASGTFDIEAAAPPSLSAAGEELAATDAESKRVTGIVQTVCVFAASASVMRLVSLLNKDDPSKPAGAATGAATGEHVSGVLYSVDLAFICLGLFTSLGLSMLSIVSRPGGGAVARVQKKVMVMALASVLVSFTLRMCMMLTAASL